MPMHYIRTFRPKDAYVDANARRVTTEEQGGAFLPRLGLPLLAFTTKDSKDPSRDPSYTGMLLR